ncbi:MAG: organic solvent tolerance protein OstA [Leptolyngbyaceae cyanobacterium CSU_1_4]|nr:organic solvent tolerance protein OstA [Leptolyngbyaceae cyanobacterium CSU_1_4]
MLTFPPTPHCVSLDWRSACSWRWLGQSQVPQLPPLLPRHLPPPPAPTDAQRLRLDADTTEANSITGVITARGNVQINYPARQIQATSVQAQYYSREGRIVLSGNVYVLQAGNSLRGETITYLVNEGRFVALPADGQQVQSIYIIQDPAPTGTAPTGQPTFNPKPEFKTPFSPPNP